MKMNLKPLKMPEIGNEPKKAQLATNASEDGAIVVNGMVLRPLLMPEIGDEPIVANADFAAPALLPLPANVAPRREYAESGLVVHSEPTGWIGGPL